MEMGNNLARKSIVYLTINNVNHKIYIGVHVTDTPYKFDNYWGCGITGTTSYRFKYPKTPFQRACKKYGLKAFTRFTLAVYDTYEEALEEEKRLVTREFINRPDVYNVALGGGSGIVPECEIEVHQYDNAGNYMKSYRSKKEAGYALGVNSSSIHYAILFKTLLHDTYWSEHKVARIDVEYKKPQNIPVYVYDINGNFIAEYTSINDCAKKYDVTFSTVQHAIKNQNKVRGNYVSAEKYDKFIPMSKKRSRNHKIYQYTKDGNFMAEYENATEVKKLYPQIYRNIHNAIKGKFSTGGYLWSYEKFDKIPGVKVMKKKLGQYDLDGNLIKVWNSYRECQKEFSLVRFVLSGVRKQTKGFTFKYLD